MGWKSLHPITRAGLLLAPGMLVFSFAVFGPLWFKASWELTATSFRGGMSKGIPQLIFIVLTSAVLSPILLVWGLFADRVRKSMLTLAWPLAVFLLCYTLHFVHLCLYYVWRFGRPNYAPLHTLLYYSCFLGVALVIRLLIPTRPLDPILPPPLP